MAVGATFAFRFLPVLLFGLWGGVIADRFDRRRVLLVTQTLAALLAVVLWLIVLTGVVQVWMVFALAIALGLVTVVDEPARQAFVEEMVGRERVPNAIALTSAVGNSARITGPAIAGLLIFSVGVAWVFFVNAVSFVAVLVALVAMRKVGAAAAALAYEPARASVRVSRTRGRITEIRATIVLVAVVGTLVYNFPTFLTLMASRHVPRRCRPGRFPHGDPRSRHGDRRARRGASRSRPTSRTVIAAAALLGIALVVAASLPVPAGVRDRAGAGGRDGRVLRFHCRARTCRSGRRRNSADA